MLIVNVLTDGVSHYLSPRLAAKDHSYQSE